MSEAAKIAEEISQLAFSINTHARGGRDVLRVSGNVGNREDVGVIGVAAFFGLASRAINALRADAPASSGDAPPLDDQTCLDCRFFVADCTNLTGECRRNPPKIMRRPDREQSQSQGIWPEIVSDSWCGEFQERDDG